MKRWIVSTATVAIIVFSGFVAHAVNGKIYSATFCQKLSTLGIFNLAFNGFVSNSDPNTDLFLSCGVVKDEPFQLDPSTFLVIDRNPNVAATCDVRRMFDDGSLQAFSSAATGPGFASATPQTITAPVMGNGPSGNGSMSLNVICRVPAQFQGFSSSLGRYQINEVN